MTVVLDSWAIIGFLEDVHPAAGQVEALLGHERPIVSWIDLGEVFYVLTRSAGEDAATSTVRDLRHVVTAQLPNESLVLAAARIKAAQPMAYADAFAAATALAHDATLWTGDPELLRPDSTWRWNDLR
jgi:predicted nucleic acid-binding protein